MKPKSLNLCGVPYIVKYVKSPIEVDVHGRETLFGQIDHYTQSIRILDTINKGMRGAVLFHEILHGIVDNQQIASLSGEAEHPDIDRLSKLLYDTLNRNGMLKE